MQHLKAVSAERPAPATDHLATLSAIISLWSSILGLLEQISTVFGISFSLETKNSSQTDDARCG